MEEAKRFDDWYQNQDVAGDYDNMFHAWLAAVKSLESDQAKCIGLLTVRNGEQRLVIEDMVESLRRIATWSAGVKIDSGYDLPYEVRTAKECLARHAK